MASENAAPNGAGESFSVSEAAALLNAPAPEKPKDQPQAAEGAAQELPAETPDDGAGEAQPTGETEAQGEAGSPPIAAPKFWTDAEKTAFANLPRELQETIAAHERKRGTEIDKRLSEIADQRKAAEAEIQKAQQSRQQYDQALPQLLQTMQQQLAGEFADIKTWPDVERMQTEDPLRFQRWQVKTQQVQQLQAEAKTTQQRHNEEQTKRFQDYAADEAKKFQEAAPEFFDPKTRADKQAEVQAMFTDVGVSNDELKSLWGGQPLSMHDHRVQLIIRDAARWRSAQKALKTARPVAQTPPQRPGTATDKGAAVTEKVRGLRDQLNRTGSVKDAVAVWNATRR